MLTTAFPNGSNALLLHITGTLPVAFRGSTYRFPISIWVPHAYPREPPLVYVTPTETMMVRPGQHVDPQGQVYHPYLVNWGQFWDVGDRLGGGVGVGVADVQKSNIQDFLAVLSGVFAKEPPVVARQSQQAQQVQQAQQSPVQSPPPVPPLPRDMARPQPQAESRPPPPPPKQHQAPATPSSSMPSRYESAPPLPTDTGRTPPYQSRQFAPVYQSPPPHGQPPPPQNVPYAQPPPQYPPQMQYTQPRQPQPPPNILDEPLTLNIPTNTAIAPPPIPPNPEKDMLLAQLAHTLHQIRQESRAQNDSSMAGLRAQRAAMQSAMAAVQSEVSQLTQLSGVLTSNTHILHEAMRKADGMIEQSRRHPAPEIDELLVPPTVVSNQLYSLVAEERALGDAIFMLGRAVERERVEPAVFVKMTRSLGREWYLKKALVRKIGTGMALTN